MRNSFKKVRDEALQLLDKIKARREQLEKKQATHADLPRLKAFEQLFLHLLLQMNVDPEDASQNLLELSQGYKDIFEAKPASAKGTPENMSDKSPQKKNKGKKNQKEEESAEEEPSGPIEIMTDVRPAKKKKSSVVPAENNSHYFLLLLFYYSLN